MRSIEVRDGLAGIDAAVTALAATRLDHLDTTDRVGALTALAALTRRLAAVENELIAGLQRQATPAELGGSLTDTVARATLSTTAEAKRRITDAEDTTARTALDGQPLPPRLPATAAALAAGRIDRAHIREIHRFFDKVPSAVQFDERERAEAFLAEQAAKLRPNELRAAADHLLVFMGHEDQYTEADRAHRRGFSWSHQEPDGMSKGVLRATPALRAELDAVLAAWAAPGKCNPNDETPCVDGEPDAAAVDRDGRSANQRRHDAFSAVARAMLASGQLGVHNGLPATIIVTTTLQELQASTGKAYTGGGTELPMRDVIRMAAHANHYLVIFDGATELPLWLGRTRRTASPGQRIVMYARDRGCTFPGCTMPGYQCEAHHAECDWKDGGLTNIDDLAFGCWIHHPLATNHGWTTRKDPYGRCEWRPPPGVHHPAGTNNYHHPERYLDPPKRAETAQDDESP